MIRNFLLKLLLSLTGLASLCCSHYTPTENQGNSTAAQNRIVFDEMDQNGNKGNVYAADLNGNSKTLLASNAVVMSPPRGSNVVLLRQPRSDSAEFVMTDLWGTSSRSLFRVGGLVQYYALSPDGLSVLYCYKISTNEWLKVHNIATGNEISVLDSNSYFPITLPQFSPDSKRLVFPLANSSNYNYSLVWVTIGDTTLHYISDNANYVDTYATGVLSTCSWSQDGSSISFFSPSSISNYTLKIYNFSSEQTIIGQDSCRGFDVGFSKDNNLVAYSIITTNAGAFFKDVLGIYDVVNKRSSRYTISYSRPYGSIGSFDWSPITGKLLFRSYDTDIDYKYNIRFHLFDPTTGIDTPTNFGDSTYGHFFWGRPVVSQ